MKNILDHVLAAVKLMFNGKNSNFQLENVARKCRYCGMQTGWHKTDAEARAQWNTRFDIDELEALYLEEYDKDELGDIDCGDDVRNFLAWCRNNISKDD